MSFFLSLIVSITPVVLFSVITSFCCNLKPCFTIVRLSSSFSLQQCDPVMWWSPSFITGTYYLNFIDGITNYYKKLCFFTSSQYFFHRVFFISIQIFQYFFHRVFFISIQIFDDTSFHGVQLMIPFTDNEFLCFMVCKKDFQKHLVLNSPPFVRSHSPKITKCYPSYQARFQMH